VKNMKKFVTLLLALSLVLSMTAFAAAGDPGTIMDIEIEADYEDAIEVDFADGDESFELSYSDATEGGMYLVLVLSDNTKPTNSNILYVNQETAGTDGVTFNNVYPKEITDSYIYLVGSDFDYDMVGTIVPNAVADDVTVEAYGVGEDAYTVDGHKVTVDYKLPCKLGYEDADGSYTAISAVANPDGSYSYNVPETVDEVVLVVKGDVTGDGELKIADSMQVKAAQLGKLSINEIKQFSADVTGDGELKIADSMQVKAAQLGKLALKW